MLVLAEQKMPIYRLIQSSAFGPDEIKIIVAAYERGCEELKLTAKGNTLKELVAKRVFELAEIGERDAKLISDKVVRELHGLRPK